MILPNNAIEQTCFLTVARKWQTSNTELLQHSIHSPKTENTVLPETVARKKIEQPMPYTHMVYC